MFLRASRRTGGKTAGATETCMVWTKLHLVEGPWLGKLALAARPRGDVIAGACMHLNKGVDAETAVRRLSAARGASVAETLEQRRWIDHYAENFAAPQ